MPETPADPGYGDPRAPVGTPEWAKRWRLEFQNVVQSLPEAPEVNLRFYELGKQHRAWTLLTDGETTPQPFKDFDAFCAYRRPYGLGTDPVQFKAYLQAHEGKRAAELITAPPEPPMGAPADNQNAGKNKSETVSDLFLGSPPSDGPGKRRERNIRAILRAPEVVQDLYRTGLMNQTDAAKMGPKSPSPEQAARLAEARQELERLDRTQKKQDFRKAAGEIVRRATGTALPSVLDLLRKAWDKASEQEREAFLAELKHDGWIKE
jgi:hypothetical protein